MKKQHIFIALIFFFTTAFFFYPVFKGYIPIPGDSLVGGFTPYNAYSFIGFTPGGVPNKAQGPDVIRILYPWKYFAVEQLKIGEMPLWNPYNFSGTPHFANLQSGTFSPFTALFLIFPFNFAWTLYIFIGPLLNGVFVYIFLRQMKLTKEASIFGGVTYAFSAFNVVWMEYGNFQSAFLWLPLALVITKSYSEKPDVKKIFYLSIVLLLSILSGYIQLTMYLFLIVFLFSIFLFFREKKRKIAIRKYVFLQAAYVFALLLASFQLLPLIELFINSARNAYTFSDLSERLIPFVNIVTVIIPDFFGNPATRNYWLSGTYIERAAYIGVIPLVFTCFIWFRKKNPYAVFFFFLGIMSYISALDIYPVKLFHSLGIPVLSTTVPSRILSVFCFSFSLVAAFGFDYWQKEKDKKIFLRILLGIAAVFVFLWIFVYFQKDPNFAISKRNLIIPTGLFFVGGLLLIQKFLPKKIAIILLLVLTLLDLFYFFHKITPFSPKEFIYPQVGVFEELKKVQGIDRFWGYGEASIDSEINLPNRLYSPEGYDPLFIKRYAEFISAGNDGKIANKIQRTDVSIQHGYGAEDLKKNYFRQRMLDLLGVKYMLHKRDTSEISKPDYATFPTDKYLLRSHDSRFQIYENKEVMPRIFLASDYKVITDKQKIIDTLFDKNINLKKTVILEENLSKEMSPQEDKINRVKLVSYTPNKITVNTQSTRSQILFLSDNYFPGWKATVDGKDTKIFRADYTFRAIPLHKGSHTVIFFYQPESFYAGVTISIAAAIILIIGTFFLRKRRLS